MADVQYDYEVTKVTGRPLTINGRRIRKGVKVTTLEKHSIENHKKAHERDVKFSPIRGGSSTSGSSATKKD